MLINSINASTQTNFNKTQGVDPYDLDIEFGASRPTNGVGIDSHENITSKSLCTPGCGGTGTYNSFCC